MSEDKKDEKAGDQKADDPTWRPFDPKGLKERLQKVRTLLIEAAAVGLAQDMQGLDKYADLQRKIKEAQRGVTNPRRYR